MLRRFAILSTLLISLVFCASFAGANSVDLLNFNYLQNGQSVANFYNGGTSNPAVPNYGVTFSSNFMGLTSVLVGGGGNFMPDPTGTPAIFINGTMGTNVTGTMNVLPGFSSGINFYYTAGFQETATVWSGANGTGTILATINLTPNDAGCGAIAYCHWTDIGTSFSGTAGSVTFSGPANGIGIADITIGQSAPAVPEPSTIYLLGTGVALLSTRGLRRLLSH